MQNEFTAVIERDGEWFVAWCLEILEQTVREGRSRTAGKTFQKQFPLVLEDRREDAMRGITATAVREFIKVA